LKKKKEVQERIRQTHKYLERKDLTDIQREMTEVRLAKLYAELGEIEEQEKRIAERIKNTDPKVLECMNRIRQILGMPPRTR